MSIHSLRNAMNWALIVALVLGAGAIARAEDGQTGGKVIRIGHSDGDKAEPKLPPPDDGAGDRTLAPEMPKYWIGLLGGAITADNPLRAQLDLPEGQGLIVANVVPESPAAKAGLKQHDILLKANDKELRDMHDLVDLVLAEGPKKGQITLDIMRHNKRETVYITPEERPANAQVPQVDFNNGGGNGGFAFQGGDPGQIGELLKQFGGNMPMEFRNFGNGVIVGGGGGAANMPNGVSITVKKENGKPAQITVKRGEETWNVVGDDPESLKQLPEDLRPSVEQMVHGNGMKIHMPNFEQRLEGQGFSDGRLNERLERMEQRLEELQKRLGENHPAAEKSDNHADKK
jgi:membrane-associated protease RseP (regulator of RpoE activity)